MVFLSRKSSRTLLLRVCVSPRAYKVTREFAGGIDIKKSYGKYEFLHLPLLYDYT